MTFTFPPKFPATLARRPFVIKSLLAAVSLIGLSVLYVVVFIVSRFVGLTEDSPLSSGISVLFFIAAIFLIFGVFFYILGLSASRCRSIGLSPWWCLIYFVPYVNVLIWLALTLWPSKSVTTATETLSTPSNAASSDSVAVPLVPLEQGQKPSASKKKQVGVIIGVAIVLITSTMARAIFQANDNPSADQAQTLLSNKEPKEYVSTDHGFHVVFPGFPEIERDTRDMAAGYAVPYTFYTASINPDVDSRAVFVYDFSGATSNPADINLEGMLNGMVQTKDGGHLVSTAVASLGGIEGLEGYFRSAQDGELSDNYIVLVRVGAKLYVAMSVGIPRSEFEEFTGSFRFE